MQITVRSEAQSGVSCMGKFAPQGIPSELTHSVIVDDRQKSAPLFGRVCVFAAEA